MFIIIVVYEYEYKKVFKPFLNVLNPLFAYKHFP